MELKDISLDELLNILIDRCYTMRRYPELISVKELEKILEEIKERRYNFEHRV